MTMQKQAGWQGHLEEVKGQLHDCHELESIVDAATLWRLYTPSGPGSETESRWALEPGAIPTGQRLVLPILCSVRSYLSCQCGCGHIASYEGDKGVPFP